MINRPQFKSRNGDDLTDLIRRRQEATARLDEARAKLKAERLKLRPLEEAESSAESDLMNLSCRLNTWWNEYKTHEDKTRT